MDLQPILRPSSIAVVAASPRSFVGRVALENSRALGFQGLHFPVNPKYPEIAGMHAFPSLSALPAPPDVSDRHHGRPGNPFARQERQPMTAIPETFRAFVAEKTDDGVERGVRPFASADLPDGEVVVRVGWSSVNYKDGLATIPNGKVARISPLIPGIDLAGEVVASDDPAIAVGVQVLAHGYDLGVSRHGGFAEYARVPAGWIVPLPAGLTVRDAMSIGTAGFTAGRSVIQLEERGLTPGAGPVLVTGATGGVGRTAIAILVERGYEVWAVTGKPEAHEELRALGAAGILGREEVAAEGRPLETERWAGAIDSVGAATLPYILRTLKTAGAVAASGNTSGPTLATTVFPFILRGVALLGIDSVAVPIAERRQIWERLATDLRPRDLGRAVTEVTLHDLATALDAILAGRARGRWVVRVGD